MINSYHDEYYRLRKSYNRDHAKETYKKHVEAFVAEANSKMFDIAACKCPMTFTCVCGKTANLCDCPIAIDCICEKTKRIPNIERRFLLDQRTSRLRYIGNLDRKETLNIQVKDERKKQRMLQEVTTSETYPDTDIDTNKPGSTRKPPKERNSESNLSQTGTSTSQMRCKLPSAALLSDRYGVSDRATAAIASGVLNDLGIVSDLNMSKVIDKNKIRREKQKARQAAKEEANQSRLLNGIYFDGRKDETIVQEKVGNKMYKRTLKEEHISIISEPGSRFIGHVTPNDGTGVEIAKSILDNLNDNDFDITSVEAIGCDGTVINTGWKSGVIHTIEVELKRPLQWFICLLHFNELPFRHLFEYLDGETAGPTSFSGIIGKQLRACEKHPVVDFLPIQSESINITKKDLSKDQLYLLDMVKAIQTGHCEPELAVKDPGPISHSRWLTCANRV